MIFLYLLVALLYGVNAAHNSISNARDQTKPNIVFIITDDQDSLMNSMDYMQGVQANLINKGVTHNYHYCTIALCCPSRVTLWTGKASHNTNVTDIALPYGGYLKFISQGYNDKWVGPWLQKAGYKTYYTGKFLNGHNIDNYDQPYVHGLDQHDFLLEPGTYRYLNATYQKNTQDPISYPGEYTTDLLIEKSQALLNDAIDTGSPFFLAIAPVAPHADAGGSLPGGMPPSAPKYAHLFKDAEVPRTPNFNPDQPSGASWIRDLTQQSDRNVDYNDEFHRQRLRALQSVDELVNKTVATLENAGIIDNTYIVYTTDNGFHIGQHRLEPGKRCPYEESIRIPLVIRGPGIAEGSVADYTTSHMDLAPTILQWTGATGPDDLDGQAIPNGQDPNLTQNREHVQVEHWGNGNTVGVYDNNPYTITSNNTYKALRLVGKDYSLYYAVWCNNEREMYDMINDPYQMHNLQRENTGNDILGADVEKVASRLDALLLVLKTCAGDTCRQPWSALHPDGGVTTLQDALHDQYNEFYQSQNKVTFQRCNRGYIAEDETPLHFTQYKKKKSGAGKTKRRAFGDLM